MDSKAKGDVSEYGAIFQLLKLNWNVLKPIGDRLPYDLVIERNNEFLKIQVKSGYKTKSGYSINNVRAKTNRKHYKFEKYKINDFHFAICYLKEEEVYYVFPIEYFLKFKGKITIGKNKTHEVYKNKWDLLEKYREVE